ncbi:hypothetical protein GlitD10_2880 [Gloeomargarita lithophora Alchichica-D10]|uniref:YbjN domain-containing protein n=1 Tax=Gloeomargarita lithophora Alchichica-D10 TaxID=1188229 RepID=A0A1J0AH47_9CYAN|nr:YbjN domain-containing protein [Gloeomargarita lithophora]APB35224.1 hypothetical protein GlitD10_2880 [Gloeomargarita lithophora Alchichica-D10]
MLNPPMQPVPMLQTVMDFLVKDDWNFELVKPERVESPVQGESGMWLCGVEIARERFCVVYSYCPLAIPIAHRPSMAEFITLANYGLFIGNFEMDFRDGELRFKTSLDVGESDLTVPLVQPLIYHNVATMDEYLPGIMAVVHGGVSPRIAVAQIERTGDGLAESNEFDGRVS